MSTKSSDPKPQSAADALPDFSSFALRPELHKALARIGYETPSPIQAMAIPLLLEGRDLLGHAPTGTGKTAAFALPLLTRLDTNNRQVQLLVLTPTRELAIQVAEALQHYAAEMKGFHVLPIYGGQDYGIQIRQLRRGVQAVVGTPGRVMDHMRKGTLKLDGLSALVLDEADEMLRMGFIDDVEWVLEQLPAERQMALFSATMPKAIEKIARQYLQDPAEVAIKAKTATAETIRQRYWLVSGVHKLDALTRILEVENFDAMILFVRTKNATTELAERLAARGYAAAAINGDMAQKQREQMVERLKSGSLDILVATDVAARGLDVERISHVINYDIPYDTEAYIHRIGRTGRAGREGDAILFVSPRERRLLHAIEKATRQKIAQLELPSTEVVNNQRIANFKQAITDTIAAGELDFLHNLLEQYQNEHDIPALEIAAALASQMLAGKPLLIEEKPKPRKAERDKPGRDKQGRDKPGRKKREDRHKGEHKSGPGKPAMSTRPPQGMERFRLAVGHNDQVKPGNIVGAIANEAGLESQYIGAIEILDDHSLVDLPVGMPKDIFSDLKKAWVCGKRLDITRLDAAPARTSDRSGKSGKSAKSGKPQRNKASSKSATKKKPRKSFQSDK